MSYKGSEKQQQAAAAAAAVAAAIQTPHPSASTPLKRSASPLSLVGYSPIQEERDLADLNDRLRKLLGRTSRERAKFEIDAKRLRDENEEVKSKLEKATKNLQAAERYSALFETRCTDLQTQLNQIRTDKEKGIQREKEMAKEIERMKSLLDLTAQVQRNSDAAGFAMDDLRQARARNEFLNQKVADLETSNNKLTAELRESENLREKERGQHTEYLACLESELGRLREKMSRQLQDHQDLIDLRIALDLEIAAYRKLLESEEARLEITPIHPSGTPPRATPIRGEKRKRCIKEESEELSSDDYSVSASSKCDIEISEADPEGRYVKLTNKGNQELALGKWQIMRKAGNLETIFKFHRTVKVGAGASIFVWSSDVGAMHNPPLNIVMKGQKWFVAGKMSTTLLNNDGEKMATSERKKMHILTSSSKRRSLGLGSSEELYD